MHVTNALLLACNALLVAVDASPLSSPGPVGFEATPQRQAKHLRPFIERRDTPEQPILGEKGAPISGMSVTT